MIEGPKQKKARLAAEGKPGIFALYYDEDDTWYLVQAENAQDAKKIWLADHEGMGLEPDLVGVVKILFKNKIANMEGNGPSQDDGWEEMDPRHPVKT